MHAKILSALFLIVFPCLSWAYSPPPPPPTRGAVGDDLGTIIRQLRANVTDLKNEVKNHETEIRMFEDRLHNQENSNDHMRDELMKDFQSQKDFNRATLVSLQTKFDQYHQRLTSVETQIENLTQAFSRFLEDFKQNVSQANDGISVLKEHKQMLSDLDLQVNTQNQHIATLESALKTVMELIQSQDSASTSSNESSIYTVQPGDNLEKIARMKNTTIKRIKDDNQLTNDRINAGQVLKIQR